MSVLRIVSHIIPSNISSETQSNLSHESGIGGVSEQIGFAASNTCVFQTTTSELNSVPDLKGVVNSACLDGSSTCNRNPNVNAAMGSVPLQQQEQIPKASSSAFDAADCPGILVNVPLYISRHNIENVVHKDSSSNAIHSSKDSCDTPQVQSEFSLSLRSLGSYCEPGIIENSAQSGSKRSMDMRQECSVAQENLTVVDVVEPLEKYFRGDTCLLCGFVSSAKFQCSARMHLITHLTEKSFKCDDCGKGFTTPDYLRNHKKTHSSHQAPAATFSCSKCGKSFITKRKLTRHEKIHDETRGIQCEFCDAKLCSQQSLKTHLTIHTGELGFQCAVCLKKFRTSDSLRVHSLTHSSEKRYVCDVCKKGYNNKSFYTQHLNTHAEGVSSFKCEECGKGFNFQSNLLQHQLTHSDVRKHACAVCGKKFKLAHHLKSHFATHSEQNTSPKD